MASADFSRLTFFDHVFFFLKHVREISPVKMQTLSLHLSATYTLIDCSYSYWALTSLAALPSIPASYVISVRQTRGLPTASFRFLLTVDTLAFSYVLTAIWSHSGLSPVRVCPCWANKKKQILLKESALNHMFYIYYFTSIIFITLVLPSPIGNPAVMTATSPASSPATSIATFSA